MKIFTEDITILRELYSVRKTYLYDLHKKYKLSPAQIIRSVKKFSDKKLLEYNNVEVSITQIGTDWIQANKNIIFLKRFKYICSYNNDLYKGIKIDINDLYKPKVYKIDYTLFKEGE